MPRPEVAGVNDSVRSASNVSFSVNISECMSVFVSVV